MNKFVLPILIACAASASAATISVLAGNPIQTIKISSGEFIPTNSAIQVGFFRGFIDNVETRRALSDPTRAVLDYVNSNFVPLGVPNSPALAAVTNAGFGSPSSVAITTSNSSIGGSITSTAGGNPLTFASGAANALTAGGVNRGTRLFLVIYNNADPALATELGIYSAATGAGPTGTAWAVPTNTSTVTSMVLSGIDDPTEVFRGSLGSLVLAPIVPEPTVAMSGLLAVGLLLGRRRRA